MLAADTHRLLELVDRKHACLVRLRDLGLEQWRLIDSGDVNRLLGVLARKQSSISELQDLERMLDPYRHDDPASRRWGNEAERLRCLQTASSADRLLAEVLEGEKRCEDALRRRRDQTAAQLAVVQAAGNTRAAYRQAAPYRDSPSTIDLNTDS